MAKAVSTVETWASFFGFSPKLYSLYDIDGAARSGQADDSAAGVLNTLAANTVGRININIPNIREGDHCGFYPAYTPVDPSIVFLSAVAANGYVTLFWANTDVSTAAAETATIDGFLSFATSGASL